LLRLFPGIADADHVALQILPDLAAQEDVIAGTHGHAEIVVQTLLGIADLGVELAQSGVSHAFPVIRSKDYCAAVFCPWAPKKESSA
jgi:hypothetical protein